MIFVIVVVNTHLRIFSVDFLERVKWGGRATEELWAGDGGACPWLEWNWRHFRPWTSALCTEPNWLGQK